MTPEAWVALCLGLNSLGLLVLGGAVAFGFKMTGKITELSTKLDEIHNNGLPHLAEKLEGIAKEQKNGLQKCVTHDMLLENLGTAVKRLQNEAGT